jgi:hypothetical protein
LYRAKEGFINPAETTIYYKETNISANPHFSATPGSHIQIILLNSLAVWQITILAQLFPFAKVIPIETIF